MSQLATQEKQTVVAAPPIDGKEITFYSISRADTTVYLHKIVKSYSNLSQIGNQVEKNIFFKELLNYMLYSLGRIG